MLSQIYIIAYVLHMGLAPASPTQTAVLFLIDRVSRPVQSPVSVHINIINSAESKSVSLWSLFPSARRNYYLGLTSQRIAECLRKLHYSAAVNLIPAIITGKGRTDGVRLSLEHDVKQTAASKQTFCGSREVFCKTLIIHIVLVSR